MEHTSVCTVCSEPITDRQDVTYDVDSVGNVTNVRHIDAFHRELELHNVTIADLNDPDDTRTLVMTADEVRDTYPHWGGKPTLTARNGALVTITRL